MADGEGGTKECVKNILNNKKPPRRVIVLAVALAALLSYGYTVNTSHRAPVADITFGTFVLEDLDEKHKLERMTSFTLYEEGIASFESALISSYIPPKCTFSIENDKLLFRAIIKSEQDKGFYGLEDNQQLAIFSVLDKNTLVFLSSEIPLFAEPYGKYVLDDTIPLN